MTQDPHPRPDGSPGDSSPRRGIAALFDAPPAAVVAAVGQYARARRAQISAIDLLAARDLPEALWIAFIDVADAPFLEEDDEPPEAVSPLALVCDADEDYDEVGAHLLDALQAGRYRLESYPNGRTVVLVDGRPRALVTVGAGVVWRPEDLLEIADDGVEPSELPPEPITVVAVARRPRGSFWEPPGADVVEKLNAACRAIETARDRDDDTTIRIEVGAWSNVGTDIVLPPDLLGRLAHDRVHLHIQAQPHVGAYLVRAARDGEV